MQQLGTDGERKKGGNFLCVNKKDIHMGGVWIMIVLHLMIYVLWHNIITQIWKHTKWINTVLIKLIFGCNSYLSSYIPPKTWQLLRTISTLLHSLILLLSPLTINNHHNQTTSTSSLLEPVITWRRSARYVSAAKTCLPSSMPTLDDVSISPSSPSSL